MTGKYVITSGMRPTGKLHFGHYLGVIRNWLILQEKYDCNFFVADWHALTTKYNQTEEIKQSIKDVALDWIASGINPDRSVVYVQSLIPEISQLHIYLSMITPQNWVERDPTLKDLAKIMKDKQENISNFSYGLFGYPVLMTADILMLNTNFVPVGIDQVAHVELSRDIARRFNNIYNTNLFVEPEPKLAPTPLIKGLDGNKMGKSFNNDIKISDSKEETERKIKTGITDRNRIRKDDLGNPDNCEVIYDYWKIFGTQEECNEISCACKSAKIGCFECKKRLAEKINSTFAPIREKRAELERNTGLIDEILHDGSNKARTKAKVVLDKVIDTIHMYR